VGNTPDIRQYLDQANVPDQTKADAWDSYYGAKDPDDFKQRFDKLQLPNDVKANLWDSKFGSASPASAAPAPAPKPGIAERFPRLADQVRQRLIQPIESAAASSREAFSDVGKVLTAPATQEEQTIPFTDIYPQNPDLRDLSTLVHRTGKLAGAGLKAISAPFQVATAPVAPELNKGTQALMPPRTGNADIDAVNETGIQTILAIEAGEAGAGYRGVGKQAPPPGELTRLVTQDREIAAKEPVVEGETVGDRLSRRLQDVRANQAGREGIQNLAQAEGAIEAGRQARINAPIALPKMAEGEPTILRRPATPEQSPLAQAVSENRGELRDMIGRGEEAQPRVIDRRAVKPEPGELDRPSLPNSQELRRFEVTPGGVARITMPPERLADKISRLSEPPGDRELDPTAPAPRNPLLPPSPEEPPKARLSEVPAMPGILPGMETAVREQQEAATRERLTNQVNAPPTDVSARAGELERKGPLFRAVEASGQREIPQSDVGRTEVTDEMRRQLASEVNEDTARKRANGESLGEDAYWKNPKGFLSLSDAVNAAKSTEPAEASTGNALQRLGLPLEKAYSSDQLESAKLRVKEAADFLSSMPRPGRYLYNDVVDRENGVGRRPSEISAEPAYTIKSMRDQFPWFAEMKESPKQLMAAAQRENGPIYERLVRAAAEDEIKSPPEPGSFYSAGFLDPAVWRAAFPSVTDRLREFGREGTSEEELGAGPLAKTILREKMGTLERKTQQLREQLGSRIDDWNKRPREEAVAFIDRIMRGEAHPTPKDELDAKAIAQIFEPAKAEIERLDPGAYDHWREHYFPGIWERPGQVEDWVRKQLAGKSPLAGPGSFKQPKVFDDWSEAIQAGHTPVTWNPIEAALLKRREMDRYIMGYQSLGAAKENGIARAVMVGQQPPEGWRRLDDRVGTIYGNPNLPVKEFFDAHAMQALEDVAENLGISRDRGVAIGGKRLGYAQPPSTVVTRFGTPESVLAHEIGHIISKRYGLSEKLEGIPGIGKELRDLADLRFEGSEPSASFKSYVRQREEKMAVLFEAMVHAPDKFKQRAPKTWDVFRDFVYEHPELRPLATIPDSLVTGQREGTISAGGQVIHGYYYMPEAAQKIFQNHLSPGLQGGYGTAFQIARGIGNTLNQFQLGASGFHLGTTTVNSIVNDVALALERGTLASKALARGKLSDAVEQATSGAAAGGRAMTVLGSPINTFVRGHRLMKEYLSPGSFADYSELADAVERANGGVRMPEDYLNHHIQTVRTALKTGGAAGYGKAALHAIPAAIEAAATPVMQWAVPRMKLGAFYDLAGDTLARSQREGWDDMRTSREIQKVWNSIDARMGEVRYDNVFTNKVAKQIGFGAVRSLGWTGGTMVELGGGALDTGRQLARLATGEAPEMTHRMAYTLALPMAVGYLGALTYYACNGKAPDKLADLYQIPTGKTDTTGRQERINLPSYMKDVFSFKHDPVQTVKNKLAPDLQLAGEMLSNRDYYGTEIRHPGDPLMGQVQDLAEHVAKAFLPFAVRNAERRAEAGGSLAQRVQSFAGITPAPKYATQSPAEREADEYAERTRPTGPRTKQEFEEEQFRGGLRRDLRQGTATRATLAEQVEAGRLTRQQAKNLLVESGESPLEREFHSMPLEEKLRVWELADEKERDDLWPLLARSGREVRNKPPQARAALAGRLTQAVEAYEARTAQR
jgi:hypothetical protein